MNTVTGWIAAIAFFAAFYGLAAVAFHCSGGFRLIKSCSDKHYLPYLCFLIFAVLSGIMMYVLLRQNQFIYFWDYQNWWIKSHHLTVVLFTDTKGTLSSIWYSVRHDEYSYFLPAVLCLVTKIVGTTYNRFVFSCFLAFMIPSAFVLTACCLKLMEQQKIRLTMRSYIGCCALSFTFSDFYIAMLNGYIGIACLFISGLLIMLLLDYDPTKGVKSQLAESVLIGLLLVEILMGRRYFAFYLVGYAACMVFKALYLLFRDRTDRKKRFIHALLNALIISACAGSLLFTVLRPITVAEMTTDYSSAFSSYDQPISTKISRFIGYFGLVSLATIIVAVILCLYYRVQILNLLTLLIFTAVTVITFWRVQGIGMQHSYTVAAQIFLLEFLAILESIEMISSRTWRRIQTAVLLVIYAYNFCYVFLPAARIEAVSALTADAYDPLYRDDIDTLYEMIDDVNELTADSGTKVYVTASGVVLNSGILSSISLPDPTPLHNLCQTYDIDSRDGFNVDFLSAGVVIATDPTEIHVSREGQRTVVFLNEEVLDPDSPIGRHFTKQGSYQLEDGVTAYVMVKTSDFTTEDIEYIADYYHDVYPELDSIFADRILATIGE
jgi:hypothetical protein